MTEALATAVTGATVTGAGLLAYRELNEASIAAPSPSPIACLKS
jgi:hypothetical protein